MAGKTVHVSPGQQFILDLLQRKLLTIIQRYTKLILDKQQSGTNDKLDRELLLLRGKILRLSARQKQLTCVIIRSESRNESLKEGFFQALGLITRQALSQIRTKTGERRRRTTANPRFSHEAIQAKQALRHAK